MSPDVTERSEAGAARRLGAGIGGVLVRTVGFLKAAKAELSKVTWPTRDELLKATRMILILAVSLGFIIGMLDLLLNLVLVEWLARLIS